VIINYVSFNLITVIMSIKKLLFENYEQQLQVGIAVEMEHTKDSNESKKIALDHLKEDPQYYSKLFKAGLIDEPDAINLAKNYFE
jgi:hypothetical protein